MPNKTVSIHISTKNRKIDLEITLRKIQYLLERKDVECVIFDDGSSDGTFEMVKNKFPQVILLRNEISKGYIFCRNKMLNETKSDFTISLDDDAHFLTQNPLEKIEEYFDATPNCGLLALRIFWGIEEPKNITSHEKPQRVQGFVGCGHVWRMKAWRDIPNYPEWFEFYGEENFASLQLFKKNWEVHYLPEVLVHHRVNLKSRTKNNKDFGFRYRRSIRSGWYSILLFYPAIKVPRIIAYSIFMQIKTKIAKGNFKVVIPLFQAIMDVFFNIPNLIKNRNVLTREEYQHYTELKETKIFWKPEN
ncbi:glycosyltransferase family 2 protein [Flavobacterium psychrotolerans]|uniref:Glycosyl transferase n=1 Tax=Flavobacterium psychrotolerans TaxID=2169410 RepID=A0A2U1JGD0_9FLAO|nr:glycosyltransferase [Flavobacterium psychrotolerans]PWA04044.1 glycosyl transferase [Flavobacterium psychrotolerans]